MRTSLTRWKGKEGATATGAGTRASPPCRCRYDHPTKRRRNDSGRAGGCRRFSEPWRDASPTAGDRCAYMGEGESSVVGRMIWALLRGTGCHGVASKDGCLRANGTLAGTLGRPWGKRKTNRFVATTLIDQHQPVVGLGVCAQI